MEDHCGSDAVPCQLKLASEHGESRCRLDDFCDATFVTGDLGTRHLSAMPRHLCCDAVEVGKLAQSELAHNLLSSCVGQFDPHARLGTARQHGALGALCHCHGVLDHEIASAARRGRPSLGRHRRCAGAVRVVHQQDGLGGAGGRRRLLALGLGWRARVGRRDAQDVGYDAAATIVLLAQVTRGVGGVARRVDADVAQELDPVAARST